MGGFIGYANAPSKDIIVTNCLHTGDIVNERTRDHPRVGGFCGLNYQASTTYVFTNYVEAGNITVAAARMVGMLFGQFSGLNSEAEFTDCYVTGTLTDGTKNYSYVIQWYGTSAKLTNVPTPTTTDTLATKTVAELFSTQSSAWTKVSGKQPFVLSSFADLAQ